ncbi:MAG: hypothetical protein KDD82_06970 [Planctomycetes bacterium]|nr:hypothetical protein [Planctomycetota bacterium]
MRTRTLLVAFALVCSLPLTAGELTKQERAIAKTVESETLKVSRYAARSKDLETARSELKLGLEAAPDSSKLAKELERLEAKIEKASKRSTTLKAGFKPKYTESLEEKRAESRLKISLALAEAARSVESSEPERYAGYLKLIQRRFATQEALDHLELVYFEPYCRWVSTSEAEILSQGGEVHDGELLDADAVAALNEQHSSWSNPWVISDEVHEVRTTVPLRQAKRILAYVGAYREYFLARFGDVWELQAPKGKLPVIVTETQKDLDAQLKETTRSMGGAAPQQGGIQGAAFYLQSTSELNPCFVTYEPKDATGMVFTIDPNDFEQLQIPLAHEVTHQLAFEYSKHDANRMRQIQHQFWAVEAIANFMGYHSFDGKEWSLTHPRTIPMGRGMIEGPFAHCVNNLETLPQLSRFIGQSQQEFMTVNNYHYAATLAYFLLTGEGGKYRSQFVSLLQTVHRVKDEPTSFEKAFPGVDMNAMQSEWERFVRGIQLDS